MKFYGEMRVQGSGPWMATRFDALAYALAEIEQTDPAVAEVDLTASLAQGWVTASMIIDQENLERAVAKLIATVRTAIYPNGDIAGSWKFLAETADLSIRPAADRRAPGDQRPVSAAPASGGLPIRGGEPGGGLPVRGGEPGGGLPVRGASPAAACPPAEASPAAACPPAEASPSGGLPARAGVPAGGTSGRGRARLVTRAGGGRWPAARSRRERALDRRARARASWRRRPACPGGPAPGDAVARETRPAGTADGAATAGEATAGGDAAADQPPGPDEQTGPFRLPAPYRLPTPNHTPAGA